IGDDGEGKFESGQESDERRRIGGINSIRAAPTNRFDRLPLLRKQRIKVFCHVAPRFKDLTYVHEFPACGHAADHTANDSFRRPHMKIVIFGGSGLIGTKLGKILRGRGHEVLDASPKTGIDAVTGQGLSEALAGAQVAVDVMNAPAWEDAAVLKFFNTTT